MTRIALILAVLLIASSAFVERAACGEVIETEHFRFVADEGARGWARRLAEVAEQKREYVGNALNFGADPGFVEVRIASDDQAMNRMVGTDGPVREWIAGLAWPQRSLIVLSARGNEVFSVVETFEHELAHLYLGIALKGRQVPRWFHEGVAMLVASERVGERLKSALGAAATGAWIPIEELWDDFPAEQPAVQLAYAQAMIFVGYLHRASRGRGIGSVVQMVADGMPFEKAFALSFGGPVEEMWERAKGEISRTWSWVWVATSGGVLWFAITGLFLLAYVRKRKRARLKQKMWEIEAALVRGTAEPGKKRTGPGVEEGIFVVQGPREPQ